MSEKPNVLFIMVDQMRADCLSCAGHPVIRTPNLDALAARGVRFSQAYVQSAVCVPSRMSFYTGRYVHSHRSSWNAVPLPSGERTMGHYFGGLGYRAAQCGRAHYFPDRDDVWSDEPKKVRLNREVRTLAGLEEWLSHEAGTGASHQAHLEAKGYPEEVRRYPTVPHSFDWKTAPKDPSAYPVDVREEDSDTAFVTDWGVDFIEQKPDKPWFLFLSFWKPHPPFFAPSPYHEMYDPASMPAPNRSAAEWENPHPLLEEYRREFNGGRFDEEPNWRQIRAAYYGLISQIDAHVGRIVEALRSTGQDGNTIIFFSSDHGEYMGDHWLQNKEMFYDEAHRVPWLWYDPRPEADATRGTVCDAFVESVDALPSFLDSAGAPVGPGIQGTSVLPWVHGNRPDRWRSAVHADWDFRCYRISASLGLEPDRCRGWMIRDRRIKYWRFNGLPDVLFDLEKDPRELHNRAEDPEYRDVVQEYRLKLLDWRMSTEDPSRISWTYRMTEDRRRPNTGSVDRYR